MNGKKRSKADEMSYDILDFALEDVTEHGLTPQKAHALAGEFAAYFFAGHQAQLVTHVYDSNHSGNCHTHIVINILRKHNVMREAGGEDEFFVLLNERYHIEVTTNRGSWSKH